MDQRESISDFYAPVHRALTEPLLLGGLRVPYPRDSVSGTLWRELIRKAAHHRHTIVPRFGNGVPDDALSVRFICCGTRSI